MGKLRGYTRVQLAEAERAHAAVGQIPDAITAVRRAARINSPPQLLGRLLTGGLIDISEVVKESFAAHPEALWGWREFTAVAYTHSSVLDRDRLAAPGSVAAPYQNIHVVELFQESLLAEGVVGDASRVLTFSAIARLHASKPYRTKNGTRPSRKLNVNLVPVDSSDLPPEILVIKEEMRAIKERVATASSPLNNLETAVSQTPEIDVATISHDFELKTDEINDMLGAIALPVTVSFSRLRIYDNR